MNLLFPIFLSCRAVRTTCLELKALDYCDATYDAIAGKLEKRRTECQAIDYCNNGCSNYRVYDEYLPVEVHFRISPAKRTLLRGPEPVQVLRKDVQLSPTHRTFHQFLSFLAVSGMNVCQQTA